MTVFWILTTLSNVSNERAASIFMVIEPESGGFRSECEDDTINYTATLQGKLPIRATTKIFATFLYNIYFHHSITSGAICSN